MSKAFHIFLLLMGSCLHGFGQNRGTFIDAVVDTSTSSVRVALKFYNSYLAEFSVQKNEVPDFKKYWPKEDCEQYKYPDPTMHAIASDYPTYLMGDKRTIFFVQPGKEYITIKTMIANLDSTQNISITAITVHYIQFDKDSIPHFISPLKIVGRDWKTETVRNVTFHFPSSHTFDRNKADSLIMKIERLEKDWEQPSRKINYYFADTKEEIGKLRGYDFRLTDGNRPSAAGMVTEPGLIFCSGMGELYFHEVVHEYLNSLFPKSPLKEGLAVFYGGTQGHDLKWHVPRLKKYLGKHPEIDLNKPEDFYYLDDLTNPNSVIKGLLCYDAYSKDSLQGLKRLMAYNSFDEIFRNEYHTEPNGWNKVLRELVEKF